jgi:hypothetical protein
MANFAYPGGMRLMFNGLFGTAPPPLAGAVLKIALCMSDSDAGTKFDAVTLADLNHDLHNGPNGMWDTGLGQMQAPPAGLIVVDTPVAEVVNPADPDGFARLIAATNPTRAALGLGSRAIEHAVLVADRNDDQALATCYLLYHWDAENTDGTNYTLVFSNGLSEAKNED